MAHKKEPGTPGEQRRARFLRGSGARNGTLALASSFVVRD